MWREAPKKNINSFSNTLERKAKRYKINNKDN